MKKERDINHLYIEYIRMMDPTEYYYATKIIGSWEQWEEFCKDNIVVVSLWRRELEAKIKSSCLQYILEASRGETRDALQAAKYLIESPWLKEEAKRGRPSKLDVEMETKRMAEDIQRVAEDYKRISDV